jgi:hypothetical protein
MIAIQDLKNLAAIIGPCLTIFEPVRDPVLQITKATTRLIAASQEADALLLRKGMGAEDREAFLAPIRKFAANTDWTGRTGSVVIFRAPGFTQASFWPDVLEPTVLLADQFQILPLLAGMAADRNYWVLALSINKIHFLRGEGSGFAEFELPATLPRSLADFMAFDKPDHDLEGRSAKGPSSGTGGGILFGTSSGPETEAAHLHDYFKMIDRVIHPIMGRDGAGDPLILAAVPRELALYRSVNTYAPLVEEPIHGSPDALGFERLHRTALELATAHAAKAMVSHRAEIDAAAGRKLLLTDPAAIVKAAGAGQVGRLFINLRRIVDKTLANAAVLAVLSKSGTVACCEGPVPDGGIAAVLRYRAAEEVAKPEVAAAVR